MDYNFLGGWAKIMEEKKRLAVQANRLFDRYFPLAPKGGHPLSFYRWLPIQSACSGRKLEITDITRAHIIF